MRVLSIDWSVTIGGSQLLAHRFRDCEKFCIVADILVPHVLEQ
jgi:hypothetical protein